jgi:uncharacterized protein (TIGR03382 family)
VSLLTVLALSLPVHAQELTYELRLTELDPDGRPPAETSRERLPRGVTGVLPELDGGHFALAFEPDLYPGGNREEVVRALEEILPAVGYTGRASDLWPALEGVPRNAVDEKELYGDAKERMQAWADARQREVGPFDEKTQAAIEAEIEEDYVDLSTPEQIWRFDSYVDRARASGRSVTVITDGRSIRRVFGALYSDTRATNEVRLEAAGAERVAARYGGEQRIVSAAELVVIPDGETLRNAYEVGVETRAGMPYALWVDASTGDVVQVQPRFASMDATGTILLAGLPLTTVSSDFMVDDDDDCEIELDRDGAIDIDNNGANGFDDMLEACDVGGVADYTPFGNASNLTSFFSPNYNAKFPQVNAYVWVRKAYKWHLGLGSEDLPEWEVDTNDSSPCATGGVDQACGKDGHLWLGIGGKTFGFPGGRFFDAALDPSILLHEFGHGVSRIQMDVCDGTLNSSMNEGLSDYWAMTRLDRDIVGEIWAGTSSDVSNGSVPRKATSDDVFPDHLRADLSNDEVHANGQIIANALWQARTEIDERLGTGPTVLDPALMSALITAGSSAQDSLLPGLVHDAYWGLLVDLVIEKEHSRTAEDILVGFAKAGLFLSDKEAVIDIDRDVLSNVGTPPTFTVWTGRDYQVAGLLALPLPQANTRFVVELANDEDFTMNLVSSGNQTVAVTTTGVMSGTWTPSAAQWESLNDEPALFYRVTTSTPGVAGTSRVSTGPDAGFFDIPAGKAVINWGDGSGCSSVPGGGAGALGALLGLAALARRRR